MTVRHFFSAAILGGLCVLTGLQGVARAEPTPFKIVASFSILGDMAKQVGGEDVVVETLVGPNGDAHVFQPSPNDVKRVANAQMVLMNGLNLEGWMTRTLQAAGFKGKPVIAAAGIKALSFEEDGKRTMDPHAWQDLSLGQAYVRTIAAALIAADPAHRDGYQRRADAYLQALADLDRETKATIAAIPAEKRQVITAHDAFQYFGKAYGITFIAPVGISEDAEPSAAAVGKLIKQIRKTGVKALFIENMTDPRLVEQMARETGAELGGTLYADALSAPGTEADSYIGMFKANVPKLIAAMRRN